MISEILLEYVHQILDRDNINFLKIVGQEMASHVYCYENPSPKPFFCHSMIFCEEILFLESIQ